MTPKNEACFGIREHIGQRAAVAFALVWVACGMKTEMLASAPDSSANGGALGGAGGITANSSGGHTSAEQATGGSIAAPLGGSGGYGSGGWGSGASSGIGLGGSGGHGSGGHGSGGWGSDASSGIGLGGSGGHGSGGHGSGGWGSGASSGTGFGGSGRGGRSGSGGATAVFRDAAVAGDGRMVGDAMPPGAPTVDPNSGYATIPAGTVIMSGYVSSNAGGSGSSISLTCTDNSFCAKGTVGTSTTYNSWATTGFNVNQAQTGGSGSTGSLALVGSTMSISYVNYGGSELELELWDGSSSNYWCIYLPGSTNPTTATFPLSSLNTQCWDNRGEAFKSGTSITMVQLVVPGSATSTTAFDYCFLGLTVQ